MARWGRVDYEQLKRLSTELQRLSNQQEMDAVVTAILNEVGSRALRKVKKRTPVGQYNKQVEFEAHLPQKEVDFTTRDGRRVRFTAKARTKRVSFKPKTGRTGGHLRRMWQISRIKKSGDVFEIEVFNNVEYAPHVEYGHRTRNGGFVQGRYMMAISMQEIEAILPKIADRHVQAAMANLFR